jgi:hypothetical protein
MLRLVLSVVLCSNLVGCAGVDLVTAAQTAQRLHGFNPQAELVTGLHYAR